MDKTKERFLSLYNQLPLDYQYVILGTFKYLASYDVPPPEKGYQAYNVTEVIEEHQKKKKYSNSKVCDEISKLIESGQRKSDRTLDVRTYRRIKERNTQSSKTNTNWLELIADVLEFDPKLYHKSLTPEGLKRSQELIISQSFETNTISTLYDLLSKKEQNAILFLTQSLLQLLEMSDFTPEDLEELYDL